MYAVCSSVSMFLPSEVQLCINSCSCRGLWDSVLRVGRDSLHLHPQIELVIGVQVNWMPIWNAFIAGQVVFFGTCVCTCDCDRRFQVCIVKLSDKIFHLQVAEILISPCGCRDSWESLPLAGQCASGSPQMEGFIGGLSDCSSSVDFVLAWV